MIDLKKTLRKILAVTLTLPVLLTAPLSASAEEEHINSNDWNSFVEEKIDQDSTPGLALAAVNGQESGFRNWGFSDIEAQTPVTEDTVFGIGSCSKSFTALSVYLLQEEGKLSIGDSVSKYLPWWNVTWQDKKQDTKIWQLLEHCSGIPDSTMMKIPNDRTEHPSNEEIAHIAENCRLAYAPGTQFQYCNLGYDVLAYITETVSGMPFEEYVEKEILQPIGMTHSGYHIPTAKGYRWLFCDLKPYNAPAFSDTSGDGGLRSTARDMELWLEAQLGHLDLPEKLSKAIEATHSIPDDYKIRMNDKMVYCNGWIIYNGYLYHTGTNPEFSSLILVDKQYDIGIFSVSNAWMNTPDYAANSLYQVMRGEGINRQQLDIMDGISIVDKISTGVCIFGMAMILLVFVMIFTQKKRLAKMRTTPGAEKKKFITRLVVLIPLTALTFVLPGLAMMIGGYGFAGYKAVCLWLPYSFLAACAAIALMLFVMLISSVTRFVKSKRIVK